ncbi:DUF6195 family protein [Streptomyces cinereoruber]|uniref:DUF6195 family protein n=1 Tax=Streptomyces cinereoruber TaxID=67260 RepID=UPI00363C3EB3
MPHPILFAAAKRLVREDQRRAAAREEAIRAWGPRSVTAASRYARRLLGDEAVTLHWEAAVGVAPEENLLQAVAPLDAAASERLELRYNGAPDGTQQIELRWSCAACPAQQVNEVTSLEQLGRLLSRTGAWQAVSSQISEGHI